MKFFLTFCFIFSTLMLSAQKESGNESEFTIDDILSKRKIELQLNDYWFRPVSKSTFTTEDKVLFTVSVIMPVRPGFTEALKLIAKGEMHDSMLRKWQQLGKNKILKALILSNKDGAERAELHYAVYPEDGKVIELWIFLEQRQLDEWEAYFDYVATTVQLQP